jgi:DNA polymerase V
MCAKKLKDDGTVARTVGVFLLTNRFREDLAQYYPQAAVTLEIPANSTQEIVKAALRALRSIYREGFSYKKAGVVVADTIPETEVIPTLFDNRAESREKDDTLSRIMDRVNTGNRNIVRLAVQRGGHYSDGIRSEFRSGRYSTSWDELLLIH